jgi:hypothetical protein
VAVGFDEAFPPAPAGTIEGVEARLGVKLPDDYKSFLQRQNGGEPAPNFFNEMVGVRYLYSAGPNDDEYIDDLDSIAELFSPEGEADDVLEPGFLVIGADGIGNRLCLKVSADDYGAVYFWDHELADSPEGYTRLTDTFTDFFEALRPEEELDLS